MRSSNLNYYLVNGIVTYKLTDLSAYHQINVIVENFMNSKFTKNSLRYDYSYVAIDHIMYCK